MKHTFYIFTLITLNFFHPLIAQQPDTTFLSFEISLIHKFKQIQKSENTEDRKAINDSIVATVEKWIHHPKAFEYSFDTLSMMGNIISDDGNLKIITWNLPYPDGTSDYFGYIQYKDNKTVQTVKLNFNSSAARVTEQHTVFPNMWYGALYYQIVTKKYSGKTYYTLLGFIPDNLFTHKKVIDALTIDEDKPLSFGRDIFSTPEGIKKRLTFEYSARLIMMLRFNEKMDMIVFDHLSPSAPNFKDRYQFYGPDLSYDGLEFSKGIWEKKTDILVEY